MASGVISEEGEAKMAYQSASMAHQRDGRRGIKAVAQAAIKMAA